MKQDNLTISSVTRLLVHSSLIHGTFTNVVHATLKKKKKEKSPSHRSVTQFFRLRHSIEPTHTSLRGQSESRKLEMVETRLCTSATLLKAEMWLSVFDIMNLRKSSESTGV